jgi:hypothetical protein
MGDLSHLPKTDIRFWQSSVFRQPYTVDGQRRLTREWYSRIQFQGKRQFFPLGTPNNAAAAARARDIYLSLIASGWENTLRRFKPFSAASEKPTSKGGTRRFPTGAKRKIRFKAEDSRGVRGRIAQNCCRHHWAGASEGRRTGPACGMATGC